MEDIRSILSMYQSKKKTEGKAPSSEIISSEERPTVSEIPDLFFDEILVRAKLNRVEIVVLMWLYRQVWCRANLYRSHGIGPLNAYQDISKSLHISSEELNLALRSLEGSGFIQTVRAGQYFVRKFFTEENDAKYGQQYEF